MTELFTWDGIAAFSKVIFHSFFRVGSGVAVQKKLREGIRDFPLSFFSTAHPEVFDHVLLQDWVASLEKRSAETELSRNLRTPNSGEKTGNGVKIYREKRGLGIW